MEVKYLDKVSDDKVDIYVNKKGPSGRPEAIVVASPSISLDRLTAAIQIGLTRNTDLRKKLGLETCLACAASTFRWELFDRFEHALRVDVGKISPRQD